MQEKEIYRTIEKDGQKVFMCCNGCSKEKECIKCIWIDGEVKDDE